MHSNEPCSLAYTAYSPRPSAVRVDLMIRRTTPFCKLQTASLICCMQQSSPPPSERRANHASPTWAGQNRPGVYMPQCSQIIKKCNFKTECRYLQAKQPLLACYLFAIISGVHFAIHNCHSHNSLYPTRIHQYILYCILSVWEENNCKVNWFCAQPSAWWICDCCQQRVQYNLFQDGHLQGHCTIKWATTGSVPPGWYAVCRDTRTHNQQYDEATTMQVWE